MCLQESGTINQAAILSVDLKIFSGVLDGINLIHFLFQLGTGTILGLRLQKVFQVVDLLFQPVVDQVIKIVPQDEPHARAEDKLGERKNCQVPQREAYANGESSHA